MRIEKPGFSWRQAAVVAASILLVSLGHYLTPRSVAILHSLFQHLYYVPIVLAALHFGWLGGLAAATVSAVLYLPHIFMWWRVNPEYAMSQGTEIGAFLLAGVLTGLLADRERKKTRELQRTTQELSEVYEELKDSFERARRAERLAGVGQLAASLAHEIRNPLASIEGAVNVLGKEDTAEELRQEFRRIIVKECRRLKGLLTDLLNFARPREPRYRTVDVRQKIESVTNLVAHAADQRGISVIKRVDGDLPPLECDPEQLEQIILNLALNAIQAMSGPGEVTLSASRHNSEVEIRVTDQGPGLSPDLLDKIFDPFFTTKEHGTGLGLSVVHQIVAQHSGRITVAKNPDKGMTFSVILPLSQG